MSKLPPALFACPLLLLCIAGCGTSGDGPGKGQQEPLNIITASLAGGTVSAKYEQHVTATGGATPYTWALVGGVLPNGVIFSSSGTISGTPTQSGTFTLTLKVTDSLGTSHTANLTLVISTAGVLPLSITTSSLPDATTSLPYRELLAASGGTPPYVWDITSGSLPTGLSLASDGLISGTPTTSGSFTFTARVSDSASAQQTARFTVTISTAQPQQYTLGTAVYAYSTQAKPAKGSSFTDSTFHQRVTRVTNAAGEGIGSVQVNYSTWNPLSSDGNHLLFQANQGYGGFQLYDAHTFAHIRSIPYFDWWNGQDPEPRWDYSGSHPSWIYYRKDMSLRYYDVADNSDHLLHDFGPDFPSYPASSGWFVWNGTEGSPSRDSRFFPLMVANSSTNCPLVFVYDRVSNVVVASHNVAPSGCPNNVMMSPSGSYIFVSYTWTGHGGEFDGPHVYTSTFSNPYHVFTDVPHANWGWTAQGHEVIVGAGGDVVLGSDYFGFVRADNGQGYTIDSIGNLGWKSDGMNVAYTDNRGWAFFSTYGGETSNPDWSRQQIFAYELDETKTYSQATGKTAARVWRIAFTQCFGTTYDEQANAAMDHSGTRIWWGSNWRSAGAAMDVYQVTLPTTWMADLATLAGGSNNAPSSELKSGGSSGPQ